MTFHLAFKKIEIFPFAKIWMNLEDIVLSVIILTEKDKCHMISFTCHQKEVKGRRDEERLTDTKLQLGEKTPVLCPT